MDQLENVQRRFTMRVVSLKCFYMIRSLTFTSSNPADYFTVNQPSLSSRASSSILINPCKRPNIVLCFIFYRAVNYFNFISVWWACRKIYLHVSSVVPLPALFYITVPSLLSCTLMQSINLINQSTNQNLQYIVG